MANPKPVGLKGEKLWRNAISIALNDEDKTTKQKKLRVIAEKLVTLAMEGDMQAIKEIGDRMDGKPVQGIAGADGDGPVEVIAKLVWGKPQE